MKRYDSYKDSGVKWLGEIPSHWEVEPFARHFSYGKGLPITKADLTPDGIAVISYGQVHSKLNKGTTLSDDLVRFVSPNYIESHPQCLLNKGDFVFADTSEDIEGSGNFAFNDYKDRIFAGYHTVVARPNDLSFPKYHAYLFQSLNWKSQIQSLVNGVKVYSIGKGHLKKSYLLIPPLAEQEKIVSYLDNKTSQIDAAIAQQQKMIDLLNERKQIIINNAVTKGLDPNVPMMDSGIDWIGQIPKHWKLMQYRHLFYNLDKLRMPISADQRSRNNPQYDYYGASGVIDKIDYYNVEDKVLLIGEDGANLLLRNLPLIYKAEGRFWVNNHAHILKPIRDDYDFMAYVMEAADYTLFITGSAQPKLSQANLNGVKLPIPPINEQKKIVDYLSIRTGKINTSIKESEKMISLLQERKQIIINDVVTGKVKVV